MAKGDKKKRKRDGAEEEEAPVDLSSCLDRIAKKPYDYSLRLLSLQLAQGEELDLARQLLLEVFPLPTDQWLRWIEDKKREAEASPSPESYAAVFELNEKARADALSLPILRSLSDYAFQQYYAARALTPPDSYGQTADKDAEGTSDPEKQAFWTDEQVTQILTITARQAAIDLSHSQHLWIQLFTFLADRLARRKDHALQNELRDLFLERLSQPHKGHEQTFSAYSSFTSAHNQVGYEPALVEANAIYSPAKEAFEAREWHESQLDQADDTTGAAYIRYATKQIKTAETEATDISAIYERAIASYPSSVEVWESYLRFLYNSMRKSMEAGEMDATTDRAQDLLLVSSRAIRFIPTSSLSWINLMLAYDRTGDAQQAEDAFAKAISTGYFATNVDEIVKLSSTRASIHRQTWEGIVSGEMSAEEAGGFVEVDKVLEEGIKLVKKANQRGDPSLRLERYLVRFLETYDRVDDAASVLERATKTNKKSAQAWMQRAEFHARHNKLDEARTIYRAAASEILDFPEYLFDSWMTFEQQRGSLHDIASAEAAVTGKMRVITKRREEDAMAAYVSQQEQAQAYAQEQGYGNEQDASMQVDQPEAAAPVASTSKRAGEEGVAAASTKKVKIDHPAPDFKRDRENTTVVVDSLASSATEDDLRTLFSDCGDIREIKVFAGQPTSAATVEFVTRESVPMARTKDKKRVGDLEIDVHPAWSSTLYVTNFPEGYDDGALRALFSQHGKVVETRWPNKSLKTSRRFAYVLLATTVAAQNAVSALDGTTLEQAKGKLRVAISDPERKRTRTDADSHTREVRITNVGTKASVEAVTKVFSEYGKVKEVRLDNGAGFVEFEEAAAATAALTANNRVFQNRHMAVTAVDPRRGGGPGFRKELKGKTGKAKADYQALVVRATGLPPHSQGPVIQQTLEKLGFAVTDVEVEGDSATIEFATQADAGKALLLGPGAVIVSDTPITLSAVENEGRARGKAARLPQTDARSPSANAMSPEPSAPAPTTSTTSTFVPRAMRGRGAAPRGGKARPGLGAKPAAKPTNNGEGPNLPQGQDAFRAMVSGGGKTG